MLVYTDQIIGLLVGIFLVLIGFDIYNPSKGKIDQLNWFMKNKKLIKILGILLIFINITLILVQILK